MAKTEITTPKNQAESPPKSLTRGIHYIPEDWEFVSGHAAMMGLIRAKTTLDRLADSAAAAGDRAAARDLKRCSTACTRSLNHYAGAFSPERIKPMVRRLYEDMAKRNRKQRSAEVATEMAHV